MRAAIISLCLLTASSGPAFAQSSSGNVIPDNAVTSSPHDGPQGQSLRASITSLQSALTELQQLQLQTKEAHWNASGTLFYPLHLMLQEHYEGISKYADEVAERLQGVGVSADGRATTIVRTSRVPEIAGGFMDDAQILVWFTRYYKVVSDEIGQGIKATSDSDPTTSNLLQEVQHGIDKYQWQMRAELQATQTDPNTGADMNNGRPINANP